MSWADTLALPLLPLCFAGRPEQIPQTGCAAKIFVYNHKDIGMIAYQFFAELEDYQPKIWRRFHVSGNISVARLAYIVMTMYEMKASHLLVWLP